MAADAADVRVMHRDIEHLAQEIDDHEQRIRKLEDGERLMTAKVSRSAGLSSAAGAVVVALITAVMLYATRTPQPTLAHAAPPVVPQVAQP
jgi:hypothetical protein